MMAAMNISTSALVAQRTRLETVASNIANVSTLTNERGEPEPYQRRFPIFQTDNSTETKNGAVGVKVAEIKTDDVAPDLRFEPDHPLADQDGYVAYPRIDMTAEFVNALTATRAYEANVGMIETTKSMSQQTLRILG